MSVIESEITAVKTDDDGAPRHVNNYSVLEKLGEGTFSKVFKCRNGEGEDFALKVLTKSFLKRKREYKRVDGKMVLSNAFQKVQKEVAIMKKLQHDNLVKLVEVIDSPSDDKMFLVLDLVLGGQVMDWDDKHFRYHSKTESGVMHKSDVRNCVRNVVSALEYLHGNCICHRDIKPENILLGSNDMYKLADFGVAHMLDKEESKVMRSTEGTYHFLAPECTTGEDYDPYKVDIWALGVTIFAMLVGSLPFGAKAASLSQVMDSIREDTLVWPEELEPDTVEFLKLMLEKDPQKRITIPELKVHPWIGLDAVEEQQPAVVALVEVTQQEIEAAFTPVNNFILMTKLKMKMSSRLGRVRRSIGSRQEAPQLAILQIAADNAAQALIVRTQSDRDIPVDAPPESPGRQRRATTVGDLSGLTQSPANRSPECSPQRRFTHVLANINIPCSVTEGNEEAVSPMPTSRPLPRPIRDRVPSIDCKLPPLTTVSATNSPSTSPACSPSNKRHSFPVQGNGKDVAESMRNSVKSQLEYLQLHDTSRPIASSSFRPAEVTSEPTAPVNVAQTQEDQGSRDASPTMTQDAVHSKLSLPDEAAKEGSQGNSPSKTTLRLQLSLTNIGSDGAASLHRVARRKSSFNSATDDSIFTSLSGNSSPPKRMVRSPSANEHGNPTDASGFHPMQRSSSIARVLHEVVPLHDLGDYVTDTIPAIAGLADRPASDAPSNQRKLSINISNSPFVQHDAPTIAEVDEAVGSFNIAPSRTASKHASDGSQRGIETEALVQAALQPIPGPSRTDLSPSRQPSKSRLLKKLSMLDAQESIRLMLLRRKSSMMRIMQAQHTEEEQEQERRASAVITHKPVAPPLITSKSTSTVLAKKNKNPSPRKSRVATARNTTTRMHASPPQTRRDSGDEEQRRLQVAIARGCVTSQEY